MHAHSFYCTNAHCDNEVEEYGEMCMDCVDILSDDTSGCIGCGEDIYVGANGYCGHCWVERFGVEDEWIPPSPIAHVCHGEVDYDTGTLSCDEAEFYHVCKKCHEEFETTTRRCDVHYCGYCSLDAGRKISQWMQVLNSRRAQAREEKEIAEMREQIAMIEEKLRTNMTSGQTADWGLLHFKTMKKLLKLTGGPEYDKDDLNKMDRELRCR